MSPLVHFTSIMYIFLSDGPSAATSMLKEPSLPVTFNLLHVGQQTLHGRQHLPGVTEPGCI